MKNTQRYIMMALIFAIATSSAYGWIHTHYYPPSDDVFGPAGRTFLSIQAFTDLVIQNITLHQFDPDFANTPIATSNDTMEDLQVHFKLYMKEAKADPKFTTLTQVNDTTYILDSKNAFFSLECDLNVQGRAYKIPATTNNADFQIKFQLLFNEQGKIYVYTNFTMSRIDIKNYTIPVGFFDPYLLSTNEDYIEVQLPQKFKNIPLDSILAVITISFKNQLTEFLNSWLCDLQVYENISLDRNLTKLPTIVGNKILIERNMFFYNNKVAKSRPNIGHPTAFPKQDELFHRQEETLMVNEYFFNSLFYAMHQAGMLKHVLTNESIPMEIKQKLTVFNLEQLIPGLKQYFGDDLPINIEFECITHPKTTILGEVFFLREPKVVTKVEILMNILVNTPNGQVLVGSFDILAYFELSMIIDINKLFLYFDGAQIKGFKTVKQGIQSIPLDAEMIKIAVERFFIESIPRLTNFLKFQKGIELIPAGNVEFTNSNTDIAPNHISTQTDLIIHNINKDPNQLQPAMKLRIQNRIFDKLKYKAVEIITQGIRGMEVPNISFYLLTIKCSLNNFKINSIETNANNIELEGTDDGLFSLRILKIFVKGLGNLGLNKTIQIFGIDITLFDTNLDLHYEIEITNLEVKVQIYLDQNNQMTVQVVGLQYGLNVVPRPDSTFLDFICFNLGFFEWTFFDISLKKIVIYKMYNIVYEMMEKQLPLHLQKILVINKTNLSLDLQQTIAPLVNPQFTEFQTTFFFFPTGISDSSRLPPFYAPSLPDFSTNYYDLEIMIHEYTLKSAIYFAYQDYVKGRYNFDITYEMLHQVKNFSFTPEAFKWTLPDLYYKYGKDAKLDLHIEPLFYPIIKISTNSISSSIETLIELLVRIPNPHDNQTEEIISALTINCEFGFSIKAYEENQHLKFGIEDIHISKFEATKIEVDPGILFRFFGHSVLNKIITFFIPEINKKLDELSINLNDLVVKSLEISEIQVSLREGYIFVASNAQVV
ncbi:LBP/BPI/CETP family, carboxy-terminal domain protein (macronuclear) [Tetrahymena thermophila SB210]|uniref:LBP/BPI/CETP family, carboxy-terminal domain protein n=1 Tax=Tetrahymena thermophila (strain SB210) TaxID=312017 RepID=I7LSX2_TETTS|nr:LBP/BPI/CETP family, carboxy-terminal domain protein [Tetrahymena thermophila SB210]EAR83785.2 LBP/BPI/CETP family, carboxy-terminal domain protein [Tetrahymena thermophila SB210]|eukprot:XP_001031448.2 LBP/BPI/CETP family, carboxy-terminal domain protein [Tetrahymena thermophila SB210]